jgi:hypothetical protein
MKTELGTSDGTAGGDEQTTGAGDWSMEQVSSPDR